MDCERIIAAIQAAPQVAPPAYDRIEALLTAVAVIVAAIGLLLTFLTIGLAVAAFIGRKRLIKLAKRVATETAEPIAKEVAQHWAKEVAELWVEKYATPEALYSALVTKNVVGASAGPPVRDVEASEPEDTPPIQEAPVAGAEVAVAQRYPGREEENVIRAEEPIRPESEPEHVEQSPVPEQPRKPE
jgi:hypothetical protein